MGQGIDAWSHFVQAQGVVTVETATRTALHVCRIQGIAEPDLTKEAHQLVLAKQGMLQYTCTTSSHIQSEEHNK